LLTATKLTCYNLRGSPTQGGLVNPFSPNNNPTIACITTTHPHHTYVRTTNWARDNNAATLERHHAMQATWRVIPLKIRKHPRPHYHAHTETHPLSTVKTKSDRFKTSNPSQATTHQSNTLRHGPTSRTRSSIGKTTNSYGTMRDHTRRGDSHQSSTHSLPYIHSDYTPNKTNIVITQTGPPRKQHTPTQEHASSFNVPTNAAPRLNPHSPPYRSLTYKHIVIK